MTTSCRFAWIGDIVVTAYDHSGMLFVSAARVSLWTEGIDHAGDCWLS